MYGANAQSIEGKNFAKVLYSYGLIFDTAYDKAKIICPFHQDLKPSMMVDLQKGYYFCFGCDSSGDVISFIKQVEKCSDLQAYIIYNNIIHNKTIKQIKLVNSNRYKTSKEAIEDAKLFYYSLPKTNWKTEVNEQYLFDRGFTPYILNKEGIRINYNTTYGVIAPLKDMGVFKGYVMRATIPDIDRKYLYNEGFRRVNTLVGNYDKPWVIITEGFLDLLKIRQYGYSNSCAILGWKITDRQISKIQQYTNNVISALDNTESGEKGTEYLKEWFNVVRFQFPGSAKDVGDMDKYQFNKAIFDTQRVGGIKIMKT